MQIRDLSQKVTAKALNENLARQFGYKLNLEQFSDVQLEDARNKLRTKISQFEVSESFESVNSSTLYQKTKAMLDCINQEIMEREMTAADKAEEQKLKGKLDKSGMKKNMQKQYGKKKGKNVYFATIRKKAMDHSVPESWINSAINRIELGESDQEELTAELMLRYDLSESAATRILYLSEGEADKAEIIMATKDMVGRITNWLEDTAAMKAEQLLELLDSIRETQGQDVAQQYNDAVKPALEAIYSALESSRQGLTQGLAIVSGEGAEMMGGSPMANPGEQGGAGAMPPVPAPGAGPEGMPPLPGEGGEEPAMDASRAKRESIEYSRRLGMLLAASKKK